jgi:DnaK suppressor protein
MEGSGLKKKDLKRFREVLLARKREILRNAQRTLSEDMTLETDDLADEMDLASSEYLQSFTFRLRGREKTFLSKIDHALERIDAGTFGLCEQCDEPISIKRLEARLETTRCGSRRLTASRPRRRAAGDSRRAAVNGLALVTASAR